MEKNQTSALEFARKAAEEFAAQKIGDQEASARNVMAQSLISKKFAAAQTELDRARQVSPRDKSVLLALEIDSARVLAGSGKYSEAQRQFGSTLAQTKRLNLPGLEFQVRLAQAEAQIASGHRARALAELRTLNQDASRAGFKLIARKALEAQASTR